MVRLCDNSTQNSQSIVNLTANQITGTFHAHIKQRYIQMVGEVKKNTNEYLAVKKLMYKHNRYGYFHNEVDLPTPVSIH